MKRRRVTRPSWQLSEAEVTPEPLFRDRRAIVKALGLGAIGASLPGAVHGSIFDVFSSAPKPVFIQAPLSANKPAAFQDFSEPLTPENKVISHNNF